jgi:hypothetical protein
MSWHKNTIKSCFVSENKILAEFKDTVYNKFTEADLIHNDLLCVVKETYYKWVTDAFLTRNSNSVGRIANEEVCLLSLEVANEYIEKLKSIKEEIKRSLESKYLALAHSIELNMDWLDARKSSANILQEHVRSSIFQYTNKASLERNKLAEIQLSEYAKQNNPYMIQDSSDNQDELLPEGAAEPTRRQKIGAVRTREEYGVSYLGCKAGLRAAAAKPIEQRETDQLKTMTAEEVDALIKQVRFSEPVEEQIQRTCQAAIHCMQLDPQTLPSDPEIDTNPSLRPMLYYGCVDGHYHCRELTKSGLKEEQILFSTVGKSKLTITIQKSFERFVGLRVLRSFAPETPMLR